MLHDLRIGKPMELAELWTSFEAISELTGIDMPVRAHIHCHSAIVRTHHFPCLSLFETKEADSKVARNEGTKETETEEERTVGGR